MKNVNLIEMLHGCSKRNGMAVSASNPDGQPTVNRQSRLMSHQGYLRNLAMIFAVLVMSMANFGVAWADTQVTISPCSKDDKDTYASSYHFVADGTAITSIVGAGAAEESYNSGTPKVTVNGKTNVNATITFTIASGVTITSFKVTGTARGNTTYDLDGSSVTFGTALTSLSKTSSMVFRLHCTDAASSTTKRNTTISSFVIEYTTSGGGGGGGDECSSPSFSTQPTSANYAVGASATNLTATATATNPGTITYKWQKSTNYGSTYSDIDGATNQTYKPSTSTAGITYYRSVASFSGGCSDMNSDPAIVAVSGGNSGTMSGSDYICFKNKTANNAATSATTSNSTALTSLSGQLTGDGSGDKTAKVTASTGQTYSFTVASGYTFDPTYIGFKGSYVGSGAPTQMTFTYALKNSSSETLCSGTFVQATHANTAPLDTIYKGSIDITPLEAGTYTLKITGSQDKNVANNFRLGNWVTIKGTVASSCTAPTAVYVTQTAGASDMVAGESFTLSAATSTGVEDGATYQWYRGSTEVGSDSPTFTVNSCTATDAGTYWCKITNPCSSDAHTTNTVGFGIKVWQVLLYKDSWNAYNLTSTGTKTGEVTRQLTPGTYYIKLTHNNGVDFGVNTGETISEITATTPSAWTLYNGQNNIKLTVTTAGDYTFGVDYTSADNPKLSVTYPPSTISSCDKIYFCPTVNSIATGSAKFSIYFFNATESGWANCYLVSGTDFADDAKYVAYAPATTNGWTKMIVVRDDEYVTSWDRWNQSEDITYNGYNYITGRNEWTSDNPAKFKTHLNSFYSSTTPAMSESEYCVIVGGTTTASTNLPSSAVTYISSDEAKATVGSTTGVITGVAAGTATITAKVGTCTVGTATVTVYAAPSVALSSSSVTYGASAPTLTPSNFATITGYSSSTTGTATINGSGVISIAGAGTTTFTVTGTDQCGNAANATTSTFTVNKATPTKYDFSVNKTVLCGEETATLTLAGSQSGVTYELREDSSTPIADTEKSGTGSALTWTGLGAGNYVVYAVETANYEERQMNSSKITVTTGTATSITTQPTNREVTVGEEATLTVVAAGTSLSYQWKESATEDGTYSNVASGGTSASYSVTPAAAGTKWYKCVVTGTCGTETTAARKIVANAAATCSGDPTALEANTVYQAANMLSNCAAAISGTGQQIYGLSNNGKFYIVGTTNDNNGSTGTVEIKNETNNDIGGDTDADFSSVAYLKMAGSQSHHSIKFVVPSAGTLTVWGYTKKGESNGDVQIKPQDGDAVTLITHDKDNNIKASASTSVTAGTYYLLSNGDGAAVYGIKFVAAVACTTAPTVTAGSNSSVSSTTATVSCASGISSLGTGGCTISSYGFVIGTATGPTIGGSGVTRHEVGTSYASTGTPFSKDLTGLTAETTYYVRPYATNGFGTAYGTETSFTTTAASEDPIPALISYYLQTPNSSTKPASLSTDSIITTPARLKGDTLKKFVPVTLGSSLGITGKGKDDKNKYTAKIGPAPADSTTTAANEIKLAFDVHDDYELNISSITLTGMTVGNDNTLTYRAKLTDGVTSVVGRIATTGGGDDRTVVFESFSGKKFSGTVTLSLWVWGVADCDYRLKSPIQIDGTLTRKASACTMPTQTFSTGAYTLGDDALDLSTLFISNSSGAVTYSVVNAGGTSAAIVGSSFTASNTGTATIRATQAADGVGNYCAKSIETTVTVSGTCTPQSLSKVVLTSTSAGKVTGYNGDEYAGDAEIGGLSGTNEAEVDASHDGKETGYKLNSGGSAIVFATLKKGTFRAGDQVKVTITKINDNYKVSEVAQQILDIYYGTSKSDAAFLHTIESVDAAGTYTYTLTAADITTIGSKKGIGVFRPSSGRVQNQYIYSVEILGCRDWAVCTAPNAVAASDATHNSAVLTVTDAEETDSYEFYYSESSTAPTASTVALATGSSLTKTITGLSANTTYYYWVRSNCGGVTKSAWVAGTPATFATTAAPSTYGVTYNGNGKTGGDVPTDASTYEEGDIVTVKGNTGSLAKTGSSFVGWNTASDGTGTFYPAGYKFYMGDANVTLYAVWGSVGATCVTLTHFENTNYGTVSSKPDAQNKYLYGYKSSTKTASNALTMTTNGSTNVVGESSNTVLLLPYGKNIRIYNDTVTKSATATGFTGITSVSFKWRYKSTGNSGTEVVSSSYTVKVGSTTIAEAVSISGKSTDDYRTVTINELSSLNGYVEISFTGSATKHNVYLDDIQICYGSGAGSGHTVSFNMNGHGSAIADIENVPSGSKIGAPVPAPTAADYDFGGWYKDNELSDDWDFASDQVTGNTTLYAKWGNCAPTITTHPVAANYNQNGVAAALTVAANDNGGGTLHYQWWVKENDLADEDGSVIPGETGNSFTPSTELLGTSYYYCVVSNDCGNVKTNTAAVTIRDTKPDPTAVWDVEEPTHGGKGFTFSVIAKNDDGTDLWDGTLTEEMLSVSSEAVLGTVTVNNETKTISGTYGVKASATSPVTFYLLLPATETLAAKRLDKDRTFDECVGGDGTSYDIRVLKANKNITFGGGTVYGWDNPGKGFLTASTGGTVSTAKAGTKMESVFDTVYNTNKKAFWVMPYAAGIKKIKVYGDVRVKELVVSNVRKVKAFTSGKDANNIAFSATYEGGGDNVASTGYHWFEIILEDALDANDIIYFTVSENFQISGVRVTEGTSSGSHYTSLEWSNSQSDGATLEKREDDVDFAVTANRDGTYSDNANASLGTISYSSSNTSVATVNAATGQVTIADNIDFGSADYKTTTITATLAASGCYKRCVLTYVLQVNKYVCTEAVGTVRIKTDNACSGKVLEVSGYEEGADIQWYKDGAAIPGEIGTTYTATTAGAYYAVTHKDCDAVSNEITINFGAAAATKIVDSWYIKNGRRTPDIALVQTTNATGFTVTNKSGGATVSDIGGCTFELKEDGIIYLHGTQDNGDAPSGMTDGDITLVITATACVNASPVEITIHRQEQRADGKPSVAFVVDGTLRKDGGTATSVLEAKTSERPIWKYLANTFALTGCNAYWSVDSKELRQYYSQFDAILITDDPSTDTKGTGGVSYVKAFGTMVDVRPVLTMEAYVGKFKDGGWHVYDATPTSPNPRQVEMKLECKNHDIFKGLDPETSDNVRVTRDEYDNEYWHVIMVDTTVAPYHNTKDSYEALPALQGFDRTKFSNMLGVGTIFEEKLQGGVERQEEPAARMMILGIQNNAMGALTNEGKLIVKNALEYLLKTNMEDVNDCANYFTNADGDGLWSNGANWTRGEVPDFETRARILQPVTISDGTTAIAARVDIAASGESKHVDGECTGSITIEPQGILKVGGKVTRAKAPYFGIDNLQPTENSDLIVKASTTAPHKQGALIFDNSDGDTHAVVEMWNPSYWVVEGGKKKKYWSYVAVPIQEADIPNFFWHGFTYLYDETSGWIKKGDGTSLYPFQGIGASLQTGNMETFYGPLATTESQDITLTFTADKGQGMNLIGNSWTAPIQIANFEEDDFGDAAAEVWVFNTGNKNDGVVTATEENDGAATAGQWLTIPIGVAGLPGYTGLKVIPAMQAFEVNTTTETTLHLDYDRLVRAGRENLNEPMRAPRRSAAKQIEATMRVRVSGELTHTDVYLLKDARFSDGFDNGWDGHYLSGDDRSAQLYAISEEEGKLAFLAQPEIEGTQLGFAPSKHGNEYTFSFSYDGDEEYYLNDIKLKTSTLISEDATYSFTYADGDTNRFYISRTPIDAPQTSTGVDNTGSGEVKARKFIYRDKMYIMINGRVYSADGALVK